MRVHEPESIRLGTSGFTAKGWPGTFYPKGLPEREYLSYYATRFNTVELVTTLYGTPAPSTVRRWYSKTPKDFLFAVKVPQKITHQNILVGCENEMYQFLKVMDALGEKLGPLLFKFGYFNPNVFAGVNDFLGRLLPFLAKLPKRYRVAVEIRNEDWLVPQFYDALRSCGVAHVLSNQAGAIRLAQAFDNCDPITADFTYVRWSGDRKTMEQQTKTWGNVIIDRRAELAEWSLLLHKLQERKIKIFAYANNYYEGCAPATAETFRSLWSPNAQEARPRISPVERQANLFG
jgi:uncharacterized protein YecE (DUF72 family)